MKNITLTLFCMVFYSAVLFADTDINNPDNPDAQENSWIKKWTVSGYLESENFFSIPGKNINKRRGEYSIYKIEGHSKLDMTVGNKDSLFARSVLHGYVYPERPDNADCYKDRLVANELYMGAVFKNVDIQVGKQIIKWGTANLINPTSYFNPFDLSEFLLKDTDELYLGVPMLAGTILYKDFALKLIYVPIHTPERLPSNSSPWRLRFPYQTFVNPFATNMVLRIPVSFQKLSKGLPRNSENMGFGARFSGTVGGLDFALSGYHGPDKDALLYPVINFDMANPWNSKVYIFPLYKNVTTVGMDFAFCIGDFTFQAEGTYSFNKSVPKDVQKSGELITRIRSTGYIYYAAGITWLFDENFKIILEYLQGIYVNGGAKYQDPFLSNLLSCSIDKNFFDGSLTTELKGIYNTKHQDWMFIPGIGWDFQNGLKVELKGAIFYGRKDTLFGSYSNRDIINVRTKYSF